MCLGNFRERGLVLGVEFGEARFLFGGRHLDERIGIAAAAIAHALDRAALGDVIEEGEELIKFPLRNGIVFVVVAAAAIEREREPREAGGLDAVDDVLDAPFLGDEAALAVDAVVAMKACGDGLRARGRGQQVAGDLVDRELIEGFVFIERVDHPIAPRPHLAAAVGLEAVAVGVARVVEPLHRHAFAVARTREETIHQRLVSARRRVRDERRDLLGRGRNAREIERHAADQRGFLRGRAGWQSLVFEPREDEMIDAIARPRGVRDRGQRGSHGRGERPVALIRRALRDPAPQRLHLRGGELFAEFFRRHLLVGIRGRDALIHRALLGPARHDGRDAGLARLERALLQIEPQAALELFRIRSVAREAGVGKNRANVAVEIDLRRGGGVRTRERKCRQKNYSEREVKSGSQRGVHKKARVQKRRQESTGIGVANSPPTKWFMVERCGIPGRHATPIRVDSRSAIRTPWRVRNAGRCWWPSCGPWRDRWRRAGSLRRSSCG